MSLYKDILVRPVPRVDVAYEVGRASYLGAIACADIRRCLDYRYLSFSPEERAERLALDERCAVGVARAAWRHALRIPDSHFRRQTRRVTRAAA